MQTLPPLGEMGRVTETLADRTRRNIYLWVKHQPEPVTVNHVAETFAMHRNAVKFHLDKLLDAGLLSADFKRVNGRQGPGAGRPSKLYSATEMEVCVSIPERHYELLAQLLLRALTSGQTIEAVGYQFGRELAAKAEQDTGPCEGLSCVESVLRSLGFDPSVETDADGRTWITTQNCPFGCVAMEAPDHEVCKLDHAIIRGIIETFSAEGVQIREEMSIPLGHHVCVREVSFSGRREGQPS